MKKVYISGPMTGLPNYNRDAFNLAADVLQDAGFIVINPAILPDGLSYDAYMDISMAFVRAADMVILLPGWEKSAGSRAEIAYAKTRKLEIKLFTKMFQLAQKCEPA